MQDVRLDLRTGRNRAAVHVAPAHMLQHVPHDRGAGRKRTVVRVVEVVFLLALEAQASRLRRLLVGIGNGDQHVVFHGVGRLVGVCREGDALVRVGEVAMAVIAEVGAGAARTHPDRAVEQSGEALDLRAVVRENDAAGAKGEEGGVVRAVVQDHHGAEHRVPQLWVSRLCWLHRVELQMVLLREVQEQRPRREH